MQFKGELASSTVLKPAPVAFKAHKKSAKALRAAVSALVGEHVWVEEAAEGETAESKEREGDPNPKLLKLIREAAGGASDEVCLCVICVCKSYSVCVSVVYLMALCVFRVCGSCCVRIVCICIILIVLRAGWEPGGGAAVGAAAGPSRHHQRARSVRQWPQLTAVPQLLPARRAPHISRGCV